MVENLGNAIMNSLASEHLGDLSVEFTEIAVDSFLNNEFLKSIPFYQIYKLVTGIRDIFFMKKVYAFLFEIKEIPLSERVSFLSKFETAEDLNEFGETILLILDRVLFLQKARIIGRITRAHIQNRIDKKTYLLLCECVDKLFLADLNELMRVNKNPKTIPDYSAYIARERLTHAGLMSLQQEGEGGLTFSPEYGIVYFMNRYGKLLIEIALFEDFS